MKRVLWAIGLALPAQVWGQSLELSYRVTPVGGGLLRYDFELTTDAGWQPGMGWEKLIYADCEGPASCMHQPLLPFYLDKGSLPVGPWTSGASTCGGFPYHCGWSFLPPPPYAFSPWIPATADEKLTWSGTSPIDLRQGDLTFSTIGATIGGASAPQYKVATRLDACYPDCNGDSLLTVADFGCFQTKFVTGDPYADCNTDGQFTVADFGCFQTRFVAGCP